MTTVAVIGAGAVGQFYGAHAAEAGHALRLLARRDADLLARRGLVVRQTATRQVAGTAGRPELLVPPDRLRVCREPAALRAGGDPDWVWVATKLVDLDAVAALVAPACGPRTRVVVMGNGLGAEDRLARVVDPARLFGLLCSVCINRLADGTVVHLAHGRVAAGHYAEDPGERAALAALMRSCGVQCDEPACLLEARWRKLVWNVPYNGLCTLHDRTTDGIVGDAALRAESRALMAEVIAAGNADLAAHGRGERIEDGWADAQEHATLPIGAYAPSTLLDRRAGAPLELELIIAEPLRRARRLGVPCPALERLAAGLGVAA
jgi:2-dehydropantoate 2-reductase